MMKKTYLHIYLKLNQQNQEAEIYNFIKRLGVNVDHVATVRNARGEDYPSPLKAALLAQKYGVDSITIHLEDRRHIRDKDLREIKKIKNPT